MYLHAISCPMKVLNYHHVFPQWVDAHHGGGSKLIEPVIFKAGLAFFACCPSSLSWSCPCYLKVKWPRESSEFARICGRWQHSFIQVQRSVRALRRSSQLGSVAFVRTAIFFTVVGRGTRSWIGPIQNGVRWKVWESHPTLTLPLRQVFLHRLKWMMYRVPLTWQTGRACVALMSASSSIIGRFLSVPQMLPSSTISQISSCPAWYQPCDDYKVLAFNHFPQLAI